MRVAQQNQKELMNFMSQQKSEDYNEMSSMRTMIQDKQNEDHVLGVKQKEKSTALFNEVVRLGEEHDKVQDSVQQISLNMETRIQSLEARL